MGITPAEVSQRALAGSQQIQSLVKDRRFLFQYCGNPVMGWEDAHLYQFVVSGTRYGDPRLLGELDAEDARTVPLATLGLCEKRKFLYEYDFGDSWEHELLVEKI